MTKKIVKVMVFYEDGTFEECIAGAMHVGLQYPPNVRSIPPSIATPGCAQCGEFRTGFCGKAGCPNNHINPWDNSNKVID